MWTSVSPADHADDAEGMQQAALFRRQKTVTTQWRHTVHVYAIKLWENTLVLSLLAPYMWTAYVSRRSRWLRRGNAASCIITQIKDSCLIVETMQFMFMQQSCERTCLLIPYSSLALSLLFPYMFNGHVSRRSRWLRRENAASCIISQRKDSCHIVETMQFMFMQQSCEETPLFIPCSLLMCLTAVHAFLAEISCKWEQSQVYLSYAERS